MMAKWKECALGDLGVIVGGATPSTKKPEHYNGGTVPWLTPKDLSGFPYRRIGRGERNITKQGLNSCSTRLLPEGSVLFTSRAPIGYVAIAENALCTNQGFKSVIPNADTDSLFLYYLLKFNKDEIERLGSGTTFKEVSGTVMRAVRVKVPEDIRVQKRISSLLGALDDKIELNTRMNDNLRQQTQAVFQEWFIENPDSLTWPLGTFSELIDGIISGDWGKDAPQGNNSEMAYCIRGADIPEVQAGNQGKMPIRYILPKNYAVKRLVDGDIVVEISGGSPTQSTGRVAAISTFLLNRYDKGMVCTNFCKAVKPLRGYSMFVYHYWQYLYDRKIFFSYENGTTGIKNLDLSGFLTMEPVRIAPLALALRFDSFCKSLSAQVYANGLENEYLASIRDALLPRLMSGELDVSEAPLA